MTGSSEIKKESSSSLIKNSIESSASSSASVININLLSSQIALNLKNYYALPEKYKSPERVLGFFINATYNKAIYVDDTYNLSLSINFSRNKIAGSWHRHLLHSYECVFILSMLLCCIILLPTNSDIHTTK